MELNRETLKSQRDNRIWSQFQLSEVSGLSLIGLQRFGKTVIAFQESAKFIAPVHKLTITELVIKGLASTKVENLLLAIHFDSSTKLIRT